MCDGQALLVRRQHRPQALLLLAAAGSPLLLDRHSPLLALTWAASGTQAEHNIVKNSQLWLQAGAGCISNQLPPVHFGASQGSQKERVHSGTASRFGRQRPCPGPTVLQPNVPQVWATGLGSSLRGSPALMRAVLLPLACPGAHAWCPSCNCSTLTVLGFGACSLTHRRPDWLTELPPARWPVAQPPTPSTPCPWPLGAGALRLKPCTKLPSWRPRSRRVGRSSSHPRRRRSPR